VEGTPPGKIASDLPEDANISVRNISEHRRRGHLPIDHETVREVLDAGLQGPVQDLMIDATAKLAADQHAARIVIERAFQRLSTGEIQPTLRDGLRAAQFLADAEQRAAKLQEGRARQVASDNHLLACLARVFKLVAEIGGEELATALVAGASDDPMLGPRLADKQMQHHIRRIARGQPTERL